MIKKKRNKTKYQYFWKARWGMGPLEYCWAITQVAGRSCCGRSQPSAMQLDFNWTPCTYIYKVLFFSLLDRQAPAQRSSQFLLTF